MFRNNYKSPLCYTYNKLLCLSTDSFISGVLVDNIENKVGTWLISGVLVDNIENKVGTWLISGVL